MVRSLKVGLALANQEPLSSTTGHELWGELYGLMGKELLPYQRDFLTSILSPQPRSEMIRTGLVRSRRTGYRLLHAIVDEVQRSPWIPGTISYGTLGFRTPSSFLMNNDWSAVVPGSKPFMPLPRRIGGSCSVRPLETLGWTTSPSSLLTDSTRLAPNFCAGMSSSITSRSFRKSITSSRRVDSPSYGIKLS